jgi:hypothetical protein
MLTDGCRRKDSLAKIRLPLASTVFALLSIGLCRPAVAACDHEPTKWIFGQSFYQTWRTDGAACASKSNYPENIGEIRIIEKAKHGIFGKNGPFGVAYRPNPGFKGTDSFSYEVISNARYRHGAGVVATVFITVIVE